MLPTKPDLNLNRKKMDHKHIRTLQILEEIDNDHAPSQRDLARKLNISLGLVNSFIRRLAHKGYFKVTTIPKNRVKYILTPKGAAEKTRLTYEYIQYSYKFYKNARQKLRDLFQGFMRDDVKKIIFYGATDLAEIAFVSLQETTIKIAAVVDEKKAGEQFLGIEIQSIERMNEIECDRILITTTGSRKTVLDKLINQGTKRNKISLIK